MMHRFLILLLLAAPLSAQEKNTLQITGQVVDAVTGMPIPRALVRFHARLNDDRNIFTDTSGNFQISGITGQIQTLSVDKNNYHSSQLNKLPNANEIVNNGGHVRFQLQPYARIQGRIVDSDGNPIAGAKVELWHRRTTMGMAVYELFHWMRADDLGEFGSTIWQVGKYEVRAAGRSGNTENFIGEGSPLSDAQYAFAPVSEQVEMVSGKTTTVELRARSAPPSRIYGQLRGVKAYQSIKLAAYGPSGVELSGRVRVNAVNGSFLLESVPPGEWTLRAMQKQEGQTLWGEQRVSVAGGTLRGIQIPMLPVERIPVQFQCPEEPAQRSLGNRPPSLEPNCRAQVVLIPLPATSQGPITQKDIELEAAPGTYRVEVSSPSFLGYSVRSIRSGDQLLSAGSTITIQPGLPIPPLVVEMERQRATVEFRYKNTDRKTTKPSLERSLVFIPKFGSLQAPVEFPYLHVSGRLENLTPGLYDIYGWDEDGPALEYRNPEALQKAQRFGTVEVKAGTTVNVELEEPLP